MISIAVAEFAEDDFQAEMAALGVSQPEVHGWRSWPEHFEETLPLLRIDGGDQSSGFCED